MKTAYTKVCNGVTISIHHDSSICEHCLQYDFFYNELKPGLAKLNSLNSYPPHPHEYQVFGILSFLGDCLRYKFLSDDSKIVTPLIQVPQSEILLNGKLPVSVKQDPLLYKTILDKIISSRTNLKNDLSTQKTSYSESICALSHKYRHYYNTNVKAKDKRRDLHNLRFPQKSVFEDCLKRPCAVKRKKCKPTKQKSKKADSDKMPTKGSLKRKRWFLNKLQADDNYEDDIFEENPFYRLSDPNEVETNASEYSNMSTPKWSYSLSPRERSPSPDYDDCYSVRELRLTRKDAEEYQHRRKKRRECKKGKSYDSPTDVKKEHPDASVSQPSCSYTINNPLKDEDYDSEEVIDDYFTDSSEEGKFQ